MISLKDLVALLIRREGLHEGLFEPAVQFNMAVANFHGPAGGGPGVLNTVVGIGLSRAKQPTPSTVDAAAVNPAPATFASKSRRRSLKAPRS
jgi:hypothetical protein